MQNVNDLSDLLGWLRVHRLSANYKSQTNTNQYVTGYIAACETIESQLTQLIGFKDEGIGRINEILDE